ncbi:putative RNA recognition motif domain, nucleotide-binding alpha-beta plait domain superfamily [Helianthus annuus]|nr:putative RNA recognition motif domain, nucleotide-binding alpha-beta plait domain superfamily [Helianthus annuus]
MLCIQVRLVGNRDTNESKGFAFVGFRRKDVAQMAIIELHNEDFKVKRFKVLLIYYIVNL